MNHFWVIIEILTVFNQLTNFGHFEFMVTWNRRLGPFSNSAHKDHFGVISGLLIILSHLTSFELLSTYRHSNSGY